jgi:hypothetical protein
MPPTDTSESGLESLIVAALTGLPVRDQPVCPVKWILMAFE